MVELVLPRLNKGKKSLVDLLSPSIRQLADLLQTSSLVISGRDAQNVLRALNQVVQCVIGWASTQSDNDAIRVGAFSREARSDY